MGVIPVGSQVLIVRSNISNALVGRTAIVMYRQLEENWLLYDLLVEGVHHTWGKYRRWQHGRVLINVVDDDLRLLQSGSGSLAFPAGFSVYGTQSVENGGVVSVYLDTKGTWAESIVAHPAVQGNAFIANITRMGQQALVDRLTFRVLRLWYTK